MCSSIIRKEAGGGKEEGKRRAKKERRSQGKERWKETDSLPGHAADSCCALTVASSAHPLAVPLHISSGISSGLMTLAREFLVSRATAYRENAVRHAHTVRGSSSQTDSQKQYKR